MRVSRWSSKVSAFRLLAKMRHYQCFLVNVCRMQALSNLHPAGIILYCGGAVAGTVCWVPAPASVAGLVEFAGAASTGWLLAAGGAPALAGPAAGAERAAGL